MKNRSLDKRVQRQARSQASVGTAGYEYNVPVPLDEALDVHDAIRVTVINYMHHQLGWPLEKCEARVQLEEERAISKGVFSMLEASGWSLKNRSLLDVGAGQGGAVLEALYRDSDAFGIEPGSEFRTLAKMRLGDAGFDPERVVDAPGERLPFPDNRFDYTISLQVLEHVRDPLPVIEEMYRVLKPGGQCYISCENYLSFREQHYRIPWLPMLPKSIGAHYLRLIGRDPDFLKNYVFYSTYPQIWRLAKQVGFQNITYEPMLAKADKADLIRRDWMRTAGRIVRFLPRKQRRALVQVLLHASNFWRVGVRVRLTKPLPTA